MTKKVVIVGAGAMGSGIAQISLMAGNEVTLVDVKNELIDDGIEKIRCNMEKLEKKKKFNF